MLTRKMPASPLPLMTLRVAGSSPRPRSGGAGEEVTPHGLPRSMVPVGSGAQEVALDAVSTESPDT